MEKWSHRWAGAEGDEQARDVAKCLPLLGRHAAEIVSQVASLMARRLELGALVDAVLDQILQRLAGIAGYILLTGDEQGVLLHAANRNVPEDLVRRMEHIRYDVAAALAPTSQIRPLGPTSARTADDSASALANEVAQRVGCQHVVSFALVAGDEQIGLLTIARRIAFGDDEAYALGVAAHMLAAGVSNARIEERARHQTELFGAVDRIAMAISDERDLQAILKTIVEQARSIVHADAAALVVTMLGGPWGESFEPWVFSGTFEEITAWFGHPPRPIGILGAVAQEGRTIRVSDVRTHPAFRGLPPEEPSITSFLGVPIRHGGRIVGSLYLGNMRPTAAFTADHEKAVELLAAHAAIALHQARLRADSDRDSATVRAILETSPEAICFLDVVTERVAANPRAVELAGCPPTADWTAFIVLSVTNRGPGIDPKDLPRLFNRFYRTARARSDGSSGLGLGLYIAKGFVEAHEGRIWAESTPGEQTTFYVTLPIQASSQGRSGHQ